ncbi:hypothetical protein MUK42_27922, partial [Musa troglodytarum]
QFAVATRQTLLHLDTKSCSPSADERWRQLVISSLPQVLRRAPLATPPLPLHRHVRPRSPTARSRLRDSALQNPTPLPPPLPGFRQSSRRLEVVRFPLMAARVSRPESMDGAAADVYEYILTSPPKPGGGEFGSFYSSSALHDQRIGNIIAVFSILVVLSTALPDMFKSTYKKYKADGKDMIVLAEADYGSQGRYVVGEYLLQTQRSMIIW